MADKFPGSVIFISVYILKGIVFLVILFLLTSMSGPSSFAQQPTSQNAHPFQNPELPIDERVDDLVGRLTLEEKVRQMLYNAPAVERLQIPEYNWWNEGLHGVARSGKATVFPQAIGLAASWDSALIRRVAAAISDEARAKHHDAVRKGRRGIYEGLTFWSPNINIFRDPRWGRGMETFGEDPYLTGMLAIEFVKGMQGDDPRYLKTVATPKHFAVHSGRESERHTFDADVSERDLRETYLPAFRAAVVEGKARSVMCAYNRFRSDPCCGSVELLRKILREEWEFDGYVVSDCWAIQDFYATHKVCATAPEAAAIALRAGTDLNCGVTYDSLESAVRTGLADERLIDIALKRLFRARFMLGMFDPPGLVPYANVPLTVLDSEEHRELALEAARKSIVLLKNEKGALPIRKDINKIAVIGPNADDADVLLGNYNGIPVEPVTPLAGIKKKVAAGTDVSYARGCDLAENVPSFEIIPYTALYSGTVSENIHGLRGDYYNNNECSGLPFLTRLDSTVDFNWWDNPALPGLRADSFSVRWTGTLVPPISGRYSLGVNVFGGFRLFIDDSLLIDYTDRHVVITQSKEIVLEANRHYRVKLEFLDRRADAVVRFVWAKPEPELTEEALNLANNSDLVIMVMGLSPRLEGEEMPVNVPGFSGGDRIDIGLPAEQENLIRYVSATGKPVVLVLLNGSALELSCCYENVNAIIETWYPGQSGGTALADVLFGDYNPAGRLPVTFYMSTEQLPPFSDYSMRERTYRYFTGEPLYPFGFGLSYTTFRYGDLRHSPYVTAGDSIEISVDVINTGGIKGEEVVELYITAGQPQSGFPIRSLQGFSRIALDAGEEKTVKFKLGPRQLSVIGVENKRVVRPGVVEVCVGGKQPGFKGRTDAESTGFVTGRFEITGSELIVKER